MHPEFIVRAPNDDTQKALELLWVPNSLVAWGTPSRCGTSPPQKSGTVIALYSVRSPFTADSAEGFHQKYGWWVV
jgi:hypothetical protein